MFRKLGLIACIVLVVVKDQLPGLLANYTSGNVHKRSPETPSNENDENGSDGNSTDQRTLDNVNVIADISDDPILQPRMLYPDDSEQMSPGTTTTPQPSDPSIVGIPIYPQSRGKLSNPVIDILRSCLQVHLDHPYPDDGDKLLLANQTGLTASQVRGQ
jgi:hypothetical protein